MALYATLDSASIPCPVCSAEVKSAWQFYFGSVTTLPHYNLGDSVRWDEPQRYGRPGEMPLVFASAYCVEEPSCAACGEVSIIAELEINGGILKRLGNAKALAHEKVLLFEGENRRPRFHDDLFDSPEILE